MSMFARESQKARQHFDVEAVLKQETETGRVVSFSHQA